MAPGGHVRSIKRLGFSPCCIHPGPATITLGYAAGAHGLAVASVTLLENGHEVARDEHPGSGRVNQKNTYSSHFPSQSRPRRMCCASAAAAPAAPTPPASLN